MKKPRKKRSIIWAIPNDQLQSLTSKSQTFSEILSVFGISRVGGNIKTLKNRLDSDDIDYSHIRQGRNNCKGRKFPSTAVPLESVLTENSTYARSTLKRRLISGNIIENKCKLCGLLPEWNGKKLILALDHINGIRDDNRLDNLRLLCPNCHSQTETFAGRRHKSHNYPKTRKPTGPRKRRFDPSVDELKILIWSMPTTRVAEHYGVSDKAIERRCKLLGIAKPPRGYWAKYHGH